MNSFLRHATRSPRPFPSLAREIQREMSQAMRSIDSAYHGPRGVYPPVNLSQSEEGYVLTAELPGDTPEHIDVQIEGATVTLPANGRSSTPPATASRSTDASASPETSGGSSCPPRSTSTARASRKKV